MPDLHHNSPDIDKWLTLARAKEVGPKTFLRLLEHFGSVDEAIGATVLDLRRIKGIGEQTARTIVSSIGRFNVNKELQMAKKLGVHLIHYEDPRYPPGLKQINSPPPILYVKGSIIETDKLAIAVVGSRAHDYYGQEQASRFAYTLASSGFTIVSGMAAGIDGWAHRGAMNARGRTIAVQGCGLAHIFPQENTDLFNSIPKHGACISELPLDTEPRGENYPARNRIIAGLAIATLVIQASGRSGALITAKYAMETGREVMAVPGNIDNLLNQGCHQLIKQGAKLIENIDDIMEAIDYFGATVKEYVAETSSKAEKDLFSGQPEPKELNLSDAERKLYEIIKTRPDHIDHLIRSSGLGTGQVNAALITLRLKGLIRQHPGNHYSR
jgi:DNA processing protein